MLGRRRERGATCVRSVERAAASLMYACVPGQCTANSSGGFESSRGRHSGDDININLANRRPGQLRVVREVLPFLVAMARRVGALLGLLCAFGAARQSPYEPAQEGWDFSIGTYWMQMDEDLCASSASRVGVPAPRRASRLAGRTAWTSSSSCASSCGSCRRRRCRCRNRRAAPTTSSARSSTTRAPAARQFRASTRDAPPVGLMAETVSETARPPQLRQVRPRRDGRDRVRRAPRGARPGHHEPLHGVHEGQAHGQRRPQGVGAPKAGSSAGSGRAWRRSRASGRRRPASRAWPRGTGPRWTRRGPRSSRRASAGPPRPS